MTVVANLVAKISADTTGFQQGVSKMSGALTTLRGLLPAVTVGGVAAFVTSTIQSAAAMNDLSKKTSLSTEFLSQMGYVAEIAGTSLDAITTAAGHMQRTIGGGKAQKTIEALGLSFERIRALSPEEQFTTIVDALSKVQDPAQRAAEATRLFGRGGLEVLKLAAEGGAAGIAKLREEADAMGKTVTTSTAEAADRADDALTRLKGSFSGLAQKLALETAPQIAEVLESLARGLPPLINAIAAVIGGIGDVIGGTAAAITEAFRGNFAGAVEILNAKPGDRRDDTKQELKTQTEVLQQIAANTKAGSPAVLQ